MRRPRQEEGEDPAPDPLKEWNKFRVVPHDETEAKAAFRRMWPGSIYLFTLSNISYVLFDRRAMGEQGFEDAALVVMDAIAQQSLCRGVIDNDFMMTNLTKTTLTIVVVALVKMKPRRKQRPGEVHFIFDPFCPVGFTLLTARDSVESESGFIMHLELLCAEKQKVPNADVWIQVGDILLYHSTHYVLERRNQDIELYALNTKPHLVPFYSKHGFILARMGGGCAQLSLAYVERYDGVMTGYLKKNPFTPQDLGEILLLMGLKEKDVLNKDEGYYMILCTSHKDRISNSASRVMATFDAQRANKLGEHMVKDYRVTINLALRDKKRAIYVETLRQMRAK